MFKQLAQKSINRKFHILSKLSMQYVRQEMKKLGYDSGGYEFIAILFTQDGLSQDALSNRLRVNKSYTTRALAKLEKEHLIERKQDPDNHKIKRVFLGKKALELESRFYRILKSWHHVVTDNIDPEELERTHKTLEQMILNAESFLERHQK